MPVPAPVGAFAIALNWPSRLMRGEETPSTDNRI
jgi:hypothetical protein